MASKPTVKKILSENLPTGKAFDWLPSMVDVINQFFDQVSRALNKRLTVSENLDGDLREVTLDGTFPARIAWDRGKPKAVCVAGWTQIAGTTTAPTAAVGIDWVWGQDSTIQLTAVYGIAPGTVDTVSSATVIRKYQLTLLILVG